MERIFRASLAAITIEALEPVGSNRLGTSDPERVDRYGTESADGHPQDRIGFAWLRRRCVGAKKPPREELNRSAGGRVTALPLMIIPVSLYHVVVCAHYVFGASVDERIARIPIPSSGAEIPISSGAIVILVGLVTLTVAARLGLSERLSSEVINAAASFFVFVKCLALLLMAQWAATTSFLVIAAMCLVVAFLDIFRAIAVARNGISKLIKGITGGKSDRAA